MSTYTIQIRNRRQVTLPSMLLQNLGVSIGDMLELQIQRRKAFIKPKKQIALDALVEIKRLVKESATPEKETQDNLRKIRKEIYARRYSS